MPRNRRGWLKSDALKAGLKDQFAVQKGEVVHTVEILHDVRQGGFVLQHVALFTDSDVREVHAWQVGTNLPLARTLFDDEVRKIEG